MTLVYLQCPGRSLKEALDVQTSHRTHRSIPKLVHYNCNPLAMPLSQYPPVLTVNFSNCEYSE